MLTKTLVNLKLAADSETATYWAQFDTSALTANRIITVPDLSLELVGTETTQIIKNKTIETLLLQDPTDNTKKVNFTVANATPNQLETFQFPQTALLNTGINEISTLVTEIATETLENKTLVRPILKDNTSTSNTVTLNLDNITGTRTIRFPDADATLLSTENVTADDINFGAGIGAANLTGRTRQQQFFYAGF